MPYRCRWIREASPERRCHSSKKNRERSPYERPCSSYKYTQFLPLIFVTYMRWFSLLYIRRRVIYVHAKGKGHLKENGGKRPCGKKEASKLKARYSPTARRSTGIRARTTESMAARSASLRFASEASRLQDTTEAGTSSRRQKTRSLRFLSSCTI